MLKLERTESGFLLSLKVAAVRLMMADVGGLCYSGSAVVPLAQRPQVLSPGLPEKRHRVDGASCSLGFYSSRVTSAFVIDLYVGLPPLYSANGRVGTSPVKLTNHFPEANPPSTLTLDRRLTVFAAVPTIL